MHLCTADCHKQRFFKLLNHCVILFGFRTGQTENFSYQFRAISSLLINLVNTRDIKTPYLSVLWTMAGGRVSYQAWQEFCCFWLELVELATNALKKK